MRSQNAQQSTIICYLKGQFYFSGSCFYLGSQWNIFTYIHFYIALNLHKKGRGHILIGWEGNAPQLITLIDPPAHRWSGSKWPSDTSGWTTPDVLIRDRTGNSQRSGPLPETRARILILILTFNSLHMSDTSRTDLEMGEWTCTSPFLINISFFTRCLFSPTAVCRLVCTHIDWLSD